MKPQVKNFNYWKKSLQNSPENAAKVFCQSIDELSPATRKAVFQHIVPFESILSDFEDCTATHKNLPLAGIPFLLKDLFDFPKLPTTASSTFLQEINGPAKVEADVSKKIRRLGAIFGGKTHLNEFAYGLSGENPHFGNCPHPSLRGKLSGGSSSGSAWAVAREIVPIAFGTDTGGSIRVPAAWCGVYGIRFAPNNWSQQGCFPLARTFDTAGWFCNNADDMAFSMEEMLNISSPAKRTRPLKGLNLLDLKLWKDFGVTKQCKRLLEAIGATNDDNAATAFTRVSKDVAKHYSVLQSLEALEVHEAWIDTRKNEYDPGVWQRISRARHWSVEQIEAAKLCEKAIKDFFATAWESYDFVIMPATNTPAISNAEHTDAYRANLLSITAPGSFARCPILTIPISPPQSNKSVGIQILYKENESTIPLDILRILEETNT